jgi:ectoine hydroxylase-related dioxygenase (phytanoyl-CoA dioxygenase family)
MKNSERLDDREALYRQFADSGVAIIEYALTAEDLVQMDAHFPRSGARTAGVRADGFTDEARSWLQAHEGLHEVARRLAGAPCGLTRLQAFDKSPGANWFVPWHQDRGEDGRERAVAFLQSSLALRIHLDPCSEDNGPLEVIGGSHAHGRLAAKAIADVIEEFTPSLCLAERGDIVAMRPLLLHRSQRAKKPAARRVIHIEFTRRDYLQAVRLSAMAS